MDGQIKVNQPLREEAEEPDGPTFELIGKWLDAGRPFARGFWDAVHAREGHRHRVVVTRPSGELQPVTFFSDRETVLEILNDDRQFLVSEYGRRMRATSGRFFLGLDGTDHRRERQLSAIIPSWNDPTTRPDVERLMAVYQLAKHTTLAVLARLGARTRLARLTDGTAACRCSLEELLGPVLDACAREFFGVQGPSSFSLLQWAKEVTGYHFRVHANDNEDRACALSASAQYRSHVLSLLSQLDPHDKQSPLARSVAGIRKVLDTPHVPASDDDVARNLVGIITGSLTATARAFGEGVGLYGTTQAGSNPANVWPERPEPRPDAAHPQFPLYDEIIARSLVQARRGGLDTIYRTYAGPADNRFGLAPGERVVVWVGGALEAEHSDRIFGVGVHKCPGLDMSKAIMEGMLRALVTPPPTARPRIVRLDGELRLTFEDPSALERLR